MRSATRARRSRGSPTATQKGALHRALHRALRQGVTQGATPGTAPGAALRAGDIITTGVCGKPSAIAAGNHVVADLGAIGTAEATLT